MKKIILFLLITNIISAQTFTRKDSLQGGLRTERTCFDVAHYGLNIKINPTDKSIVGYNDISFRIDAKKTNKIQIDLFENLQVDSIYFENKKLNYKREFNAVFIEFPYYLLKGSENTIRFHYSGKPQIAKNAPWDGGFVFSKDSQGKDFIAVACQGTGASLWFPCKDSQTDEPDYGAWINVAVPNGLMCVSNGRLKGSEELKNGYTNWNWEVRNPINSYDITVNIADYAHIHDKLNELDLNSLDIDYYVLKENEAKAKTHFDADVKSMLTCFESKFGEYPFKNDGYKLVETPYLGMEHQSAVAYGNKYKKGYLGRDLSGTGVGLLFDFIIVHESGHEWFGNSITSKDIADMWIHEGFTQYTECVFVECIYGYDKSQEYTNGLKQNVRNDKPIIGQYGVNNEGSGDMYPKGALLLNTIRHIVNDDDKWWKILLKYSKTYKHKIIDTETVIAFFNRESGLNLTPVFNQYLRYATIPSLVLKQGKNKLEYKWQTTEPNFTMPIDILVDGKKMRIEPTNDFQTATFKVCKKTKVEVETDRFFIDVKRI
jgi:aminopeptidase N